jgi:splicing factor 3B subunit 3
VCVRVPSVSLDFDTIAGGDKFGNIFVLRLPKDISEEVEDDATGAALKIGKPVLNGAPHKVCTRLYGMYASML